MSRLLARIMLAVLMLPLGLLVYIIAFAVLYEMVLRSRREETAFLLSGLLTGLFVAGYWFLLWFRSVRWSRTRILMSGIAFPAAAVVGATIGALMDVLENGLGSLLGGPVGTSVWLVLTIFIWRETARERSRRLDAAGPETLVCPACGYNLTGLSRSECPECGAAYTINELIASQPGRENAELEARSAA